MAYGIIGKGSEGYAYLAKENDTGKVVLIVKVVKSSSTEDKNNCMKELDMQTSLDHKNIMPIKNLFTNSDGKLFYAISIAWQADLKLLINAHKEKGEVLNEDLIMRFLYMITNTLAYLHAKGIYH